MRRIKIVSYKRKQHKITDYKKRMKLLAGNLPRLVVRKSLRNVSAQIIEFNAKGDKVIASANGLDLKKFGWNYSSSNLPAAYLTGILIGKKAAHHKIKKAVLDIGLSRSVSGSSQYALLKGAVEAGLEVPHSKDMLPSDDRTNGSHIAAYSKHAKDRQFSSYKKEDLAKIAEAVSHTKSKIIKETEHAKK